MQKINWTKEEAQKLAARFGVGQDTVNSFRYVGESNMSNDAAILSDNERKQRIGQCLPKKKNDNEPQFDAVVKKDAEVGGIAVDRLRSLIERIERLDEEKAALGADITAVFAEAKSAGFDVKAMRAVLKLRKMDAADRDEQEFLLETYCKALDL